MDKTMIVAGIGSRKGVTAGEVIDAIDHALRAHGLQRSDLTMLATTDFKHQEIGIFAAGEELRLPVKVITHAASTPPSPSWGGGSAILTHSPLSQALAGTPSVSETAALVAAGPGAKLAGPRLAVGRATCAIAFGSNAP